MGLIEEQWAQLAQLCQANGYPPPLVEEMRKVFYAGAGVTYRLLIEDTRERTIAEINARVTAIRNEVAAHMEALAQEHLEKRRIN